MWLFYRRVFYITRPGWNHLSPEAKSRIKARIMASIAVASKESTGTTVQTLGQLTATHDPSSLTPELRRKLDL